MRKLFLLFLLLFSISKNASSQTAPAITGNVKDSKLEPVEFATAVLLQSTDSSLVKGVLTDGAGNYQFEQVEQGNYLVMISQIGYDKAYSPVININETGNHVNIPEIKLEARSTTLNEVSVVATRPFIEHRLDKIIVNVENSIVNAGGTALEVLKRSPGVTVDNDGNISLRGKQGVLVMLDGKPAYLSRKDLYELLRNMPADQLSQIEIITNPSAKYDAAGTSGILNIKLRKKQNIGMNGSVRLSYGQGAYPDFGTGINMNYRNEKFNVFGAYDFMRGFYFERITMKRRFNSGAYTSSFFQSTFDKGDFSNHNFRSGLDYYLSRKHTIGVLVKGNLSKNYDNTRVTTDILNNSDVADSGYVTQNINNSKWNNVSGNFNYRFQIDTAGRELSADADYARYDNSNDFRFETNHYYTDGSPGYEELATDNQPASIAIKSFKFDYTHPLKNNQKIETGAKSSDVTTDNDVQYFNYQNNIAIVDTGKTNHFRYNENINAAYLNWSGEFKKFGLQLGLRAEQTVADGIQLINSASFKRDYVQFFPSTFISYQFNDKHEIHGSYSRRIDRPNYQQLNPFKYFIDPYNYMEGNPFLEPQLTNAFEFSYTLMKLYTLSVNYSHTTDAMTQITKQIDSTYTTFVTTENLDANENYGIGLSIPLHLTDWWESSNNVNLFNNRYRGISSVGAVDKKLTSYTLNSYNSFRLSGGWSFELNGYYNSPMVWGTLLINPTGSVSAGISKRFFKDKMQLRVNINDIFHTDIMNSKIEYQNINVDFKRVYDSQFIRVHVMYNFGKKTVPRSKHRKTGSENEENRVKTGR